MEDVEAMPATVVLKEDTRQSKQTHILTLKSRSGSGFRVTEIHLDQRGLVVQPVRPEATTQAEDSRQQFQLVTNGSSDAKQHWQVSFEVEQPLPTSQLSRSYRVPVSVFFVPVKTVAQGGQMQ